MSIREKIVERALWDKNYDERKEQLIFDNMRDMELEARAKVLEEICTQLIDHIKTIDP